MFYCRGKTALLISKIVICAPPGKPSGFAEEPSRGKHPLDSKLDDNASSTSTSKRRRLHGGKNTNDTQSMHGAASTLVGLAQTLPKDEEHASGRCGRRSGSLDGGTHPVVCRDVCRLQMCPSQYPLLFL